MEAQQATARETVVLKGSRRGLSVVIDEDAPFEQVLESLRHKLLPARKFFAGAPVRLEVGCRLATWSQWLQLIDTLKECGLEVEVGGAAEPSLSGPSERRGALSLPEAPRAIIGSARLAADPSGAGLSYPARGRHSRQAGLRTLLVRRTLRSGQRIAFDGNVVVLGDVNPGAEVVAAGDIVVMGALRGVAHAGARGDEQAIVVALRLSPLQLRIAHRVARAPEEPDGAQPARGPELARVRGEVVEVQPYAAFTEEGAQAWRGELSSSPAGKAG